jgi:hypothetical protein
LAGTHQQHFYTDDITLLEKKTNDIKTEALLEASKEFGLGLVMCRHQNAGQNHNIMIADRIFENVTKFKYLGTTVANRNYILQKLRTD